MRRWLRVGAVMVTAGLLVLANGLSAFADNEDLYPNEWPMQVFNANQIRSDGYHGQGVVVAVIDSGVDASQPDLSASVLPGADCSGLTCTTPDSGDAATDMHGTGMAALIAAHGHGTDAQGNVIGMVGLATRAKILPIKVTANAAGNAGTVPIAQGIVWAVQNGAKVINLSIGALGTASSLNSAVDYAIQHNVVVVAAAGNTDSGSSDVEYPAALPGVVAVSGVQQGANNTFGFWTGSAYGPKVVLAGPANHVATAGAGSTGYDYENGTSPATALVSGEAALLVGEHPGWTAGQVIGQMIATATPAKGVAQGRRDDYLGYGVMNPLKAVTSASVPSQTSDPLCDSSCDTSASAGTGGAGASAAPTTSAPAAASASSSSNTGLIVGVVAGAVVVIGIVVALVVARRRRNRRGPPAPPTYGGGPGGYGYPQQPYPPR